MGRNDVMIFGPNGETISKTGDSYYTNSGYVHKSGSMYFGPNGQSVSESGDMLFTNQGSVNISGDMMYTPTGMYHRSGSMLYGPNGEIWTGIESMEDAKVVVMNDLARTVVEKNNNQQGVSKPLIPWDKSDGEPINLSTGALIALIAAIGIGALLLIIFL